MDNKMKFCRSVIILLCLLFAMFLFGISLLQTVDVSTPETIVFGYDTPLAFLVALPYVAVALLLLKRRFREPSSPWHKRRDGIVWRAPYLLACLSVLSGVLWVVQSKAAPVHDPWICFNGASGFMRGDYSALEGYYFRRYPFQLGYVFFVEMLMRFFGLFGFDFAGSAMNMQVVNVVCLGVAYLGLVKIAHETFKRDAVTLITAGLLFLCFQPVMFSTFIYGNTPGFMFSVLTIWFALRFFNADSYKSKAVWGAASALCVGLAVLNKYNNMIVLVALCIMLVLDLLRGSRNLRRFCFSAGFLLLAVLFGLGMSRFAIWQYEKRSGIQLPDGAPILAWAVMGLNESAIAPGWHNPEPLRVYEHLGYDTAAANQQHLRDIKARLSKFAAEPDYTMEFFFRKFTSQWNEPTFQSIWVNQHGRSGKQSGIAAWVCGSGEPAVKSYMNIYNSLVLFGFTVGLVRLFKRRKTQETWHLNAVFLPLIILGGVMYHLVFEAKSQYGVFYFVMMIPVAAYGLLGLVEFAERKFLQKFL